MSDPTIPCFCCERPIHASNGMMASRDFPWMPGAHAVPRIMCGYCSLRMGAGSPSHQPEYLYGPWEYAKEPHPQTPWSW